MALSRLPTRLRDSSPRCEPLLEARGTLPLAGSPLWLPISTPACWSGASNASAAAGLTPGKPEVAPGCGTASGLPGRAGSSVACGAAPTTLAPTGTASLLPTRWGCASTEACPRLRAAPLPSPAASKRLPAPPLSHTRPGASAGLPAGTSRARLSSGSRSSHLCHSETGAASPSPLGASLRCCRNS